MLIWILAVFALYLVQIYSTSLIYLPTIGIMGHVGPRDAVPPKAGLCGRSERALVNLKENLPFFLTFAVLSFVIVGTDQDKAILGAQIFLAGRIGFFAAYLAGVPWVRSGLYGASILGLVFMLLALL